MIVLAQFKFIATYFVIAVWPSLLIGAGVIASIIMPPPGSEWPFAANVLMWVGILTMLASLALLLKKLFGRQPSLGEVLSGLVTTKSLSDYKEEMRLRTVGIEKQISEARHKFDERANTDLVRVEKTFQEIFARGEQRDKDVRRLSDTISRLQERTENHVRKLDQYDAKFDKMLEKVSAAAERGVRQAQQQQE